MMIVTMMQIMSTASSEPLFKHDHGDNYHTPIAIMGMGWWALKE